MVNKMLIGLALLGVLLSGLRCVAESGFTEIRPGIFANDAEIEQIHSNMMTYEANVYKADIERIGALLMHADSQEWTVETLAYNTLLKSKEEHLSIPSNDIFRITYLFHVTYQHNEAQNYSWLLIPEHVQWAGVSVEANDLSFKPLQQVISECEAVLSQLCPGFAPMCVEAISLDSCELEQVYSWLYANDAMFAQFIDIGKLTTKSDWDIQDEVYRFAFVFCIDDTILYNHAEPSIRLPSEEAMPIAHPIYATIAYNRDGIISFEISDCIRLMQSKKDEKIITAKDAFLLAAKKYDDIILTAPIYFTEIDMEYIPLLCSNGTRSIEPYWRILACQGNPNADPFTALRVNAITGEVIE